MSKIFHPAGKGLKLGQIDPRDTGAYKNEEEVARTLEENQKALYDLHYQMYAENRRSVLIIFQGSDASGKDGAARYLARGFSPLGCTIRSFKAPSDEEIDHDYLWRVHKICPGRGEVAIFNRSHYEEVSTVKVHRELIENQLLPPEIAGRKDLFQQRYRQIRDFERMLTENGTTVIKFLLHISMEEQEKRLTKRIHDPKKRWKSSPRDMDERKYWNDYMESFEAMIAATSTNHAPWYVIPADRKWYRNYLIGEITLRTMKKFPMSYPGVQKI